MKRFFILFIILFLAGCKNDADITQEEVDLILYSGHSEELTNFYVKEFQEQSQLKVKTILGSGNEMMDVAKTNKDTLPGDVIIGVGSDTLDLNNDMLAPYSSKILDKIDDGYDNLDKSWIGDFKIPMVIIYNKQIMLEKDIPTTWDDLLNEKFKGQIAMGEPTVSGSTYTQLVTLLRRFKEENMGWDFIEDLLVNIDGETLDNTLDIPLKVHEGEYMLGITLESYAYEYLQQNNNLGFVYPDDGTTARSSGVAILKDGNHSENAEKFVSFILSAKAQQAVAENFYRRPTHVEVDDPPELAPSEEISFVEYDYQWSTTYHSQILEKWVEIKKSIGD